MTRRSWGRGSGRIWTLGGAALLSALSVACGKTTNETGDREEASPEASEPDLDDSPTESSPSLPQAPTHRLVLLSSSGDSLRVVQEKVLEGPGPRAPKDLHRAAWSFDALGADGKVLFRDNVMNPHFVRGEFAPRDGGTTPDHVEVVRPEPTSLTVRVPSGTKALRFYDEPLVHRSEGRVFAEVDLPEGGDQ